MRCRNVPNAGALLRMALAYAVTDLSLKDVAAWAQAERVARISGPGLFYRIREAESWLAALLGQVLTARVSSHGTAGLRLRLVDATVVNGPGQRSTDWRIHAVTDPKTGTFQSVSISDEHGAEGFERHRFEAGDVVLGDRAYATAKGVHAVAMAKAQVVARLNPRTIRVCRPDRTVCRLLDLSPSIPAAGVLDTIVSVPVPPERRTKSHKSCPLKQAAAWVPARVLAARTRHGEVTWVITTIPREQADAAFVMGLYRLRWQVELFFKRLKSILWFDALPSRRGPTARSWMLARLLAAALAQRLISPNDALSPWGYDIANVTDQRVVEVPHGNLGSASDHTRARSMARGD